MEGRTKAQVMFEMNQLRKRLEELEREFREAVEEEVKERHLFTKER
jgi:hypothetical protein